MILGALSHVESDCCEAWGTENHRHYSVRHTREENIWFFTGIGGEFQLTQLLTWRIMLLFNFIPSLYTFSYSRIWLHPSNTWLSTHCRPPFSIDPDLCLLSLPHGIDKNIVCWQLVFLKHYGWNSNWSTRTPLTIHPSLGIPITAAQNRTHWLNVSCSKK